MPKLTKIQQDQRRARILDAAELCFPRTGFHRTTMQDICREAGISAGALYLYFDSKEALIAGIVERDREQVLEKFGALNEASDFVQGLQTVMRTCIIEQPRHKSVLFIEIGAEATRNPAISKILSHCDQSIRASLRDLLVRATAEGRIEPTVEIDKLTLTMSIIADGLFWRSAIDPDFHAGDVAAVTLAMIAPLVGAHGAGQPVLPLARAAISSIHLSDAHS